MVCVPVTAHAYRIAIRLRARPVLLFPREGYLSDIVLPKGPPPFRYIAGDHLDSPALPQNAAKRTLYP